jgi:hypothetical protein
VLSHAQSQSQALASSSASASALLDGKIEECAAGLAPSVTKQLFSISEDNAATIVKYIDALKTEVNPSDSYRRNIILLLCRFSNYHKNKAFKEISRDDFVNFLDSLRKTETQDPMHQWIGTYNLFRVDLMRFFKWLEEVGVVIPTGTKAALQYSNIFPPLNQTQTIELDEIIPPFKKPNATDLKNALQFTF